MAESKMTMQQIQEVSAGDTKSFEQISLELIQDFRILKK